MLCAMDDSTRTLPPFDVRPAAIDRIASHGGTVRIALASGGCGGLAFEFQLGEPDPSSGEGWNRFGCPGAWLLVREDALEVLEGAVLDHSDRIRPPRFRVLAAPHAPDRCPCRRSFGKPWPGPGEQHCWSYRPMPWDSTYEPPARWRRQTGWDGAVDEGPPGGLTPEP